MNHNNDSQMELFFPATQENATHFPYPAIGRPRYFLPVENTAACTGKLFFLSALKRLKFDTAHLAGTLFFSRRISALREADWVAELKKFAGSSKATLVVYAGTPGPNTKKTVLLLDETHQPLSICKIASSGTSVALLENEWLWLNSLAEQPQLKAYLPRPIAAQRFGLGYAIVQSVNTGGMSSTLLEKRKIDFLATLQEITEVACKFSGSIMHETMLDRIDNLNVKMTVLWQTRVKKALGQVERGFQGNILRMGAAHRDFVPWNMRETATGVFVFDWEYACHGYLPLYDLFHFMLLPLVLKCDVPLRKLSRVLKEITTVAQLGLPASASIKIDHQLLAYMLDLALLYLDANNGQDAGDKVLARYGRLIDLFDSWRAV